MEKCCHVPIKSMNLRSTILRPCLWARSMTDWASALVSFFARTPWSIAIDKIPPLNPVIRLFDARGADPPRHRAQETSCDGPFCAVRPKELAALQAFLPIVKKPQMIAGSFVDLRRPSELRPALHRDGEAPYQSERLEPLRIRFRKHGLRSGRKPREVPLERPAARRLEVRPQQTGWRLSKV